MNTPEVKDQVQYAATFLRSIGVYTGPMPFAKGEITSIRKYGKDFAIATVDWDADGIPEKVNIKNLKKVTDWEPN